MSVPKEALLRDWELSQPTARQVRRDLAAFEGALRAEAARLERELIEPLIAVLIDELDRRDAEIEDREPDADDEITSEDDGVVVNLRAVGRQWEPGS